jgi:hypothetical protein
VTSVALKRDECTWIWKEVVAPIEFLYIRESLLPNMAAEGRKIV